jgi:hypothetical protein
MELLRSLPVAMSIMRNDTFCTTIVRKKRGNRLQSRDFRWRQSRSGSLPVTSLPVSPPEMRLEPCWYTTGPNEITHRVHKELAIDIAPILTLIFKISLESGVVHSYWKSAHVAPVYKKGPKYNPENDRPISLTCICCKLLKHIVVSNIMLHVDEHNILYPLQHGFRKFWSCKIHATCRVPRRRDSKFA